MHDRIRPTTHDGRMSTVKTAMPIQQPGHEALATCRLPLS